jgi:hypothetical protein
LQFTPDYQPAPGITRYLCGTQPIISLSALQCGLDVFTAAEALGGMAALRTKSLALTDLFIQLVEERCAGHGLGLATPREHARRGSQVCLPRRRRGRERPGQRRLRHRAGADRARRDWRLPQRPAAATARTRTSCALASRRCTSALKTCGTPWSTCARCWKHHGPIGQVPCGRWGAVMQELLADDAPATVSANQHVTLYLPVGSNLQGYLGLALDKIEDRAAQVEFHLRVGLQCLNQQGMNVCPVDGGIGCAVTLGERVVQAQSTQNPTRHGTANLQTLGKRCHLRDGVRQTPPVQHTHDIRSELNAGADLRKRTSPLKQIDLRPIAGTSKRRRQPANSTTHDQHLAHANAFINF